MWLLAIGTWQIAFAQQSPIEVSFSVLPDGYPNVTVRNNYSRSITGFIMTVNPAGAGSNIRDEVRSYHDVYINNHHDRKIARGDSLTIPVPHIVGTDATKLEPRFMAVVFEDGTAWGDDHWISKITSMRKRLAEEIQVLQGILDLGIQANLPGDALLAQVENERSLRAIQNQTAELEVSLIDNLALDNMVEGLRSIAVVDQTSIRGKAFRRLGARMEEWRLALASAVSPVLKNISLTDVPLTNVSRQHVRFVRSATPLPIALRSTMKMPFTMLQAECTAANSSFVVPAVNNPNNCGTTIWELVATASDGARLDVGQTTAFGQCYGNYTDCQGTFHNPTNTGMAGIKFAPHSFLDNNTPAVKFGWSIDNWQAASYQACSCTDPDPDGETETSPTKGVILSPFWIHDCS